MRSNDPRHGTINGYSNLKCRCQPCRDAWAIYIKKRRLERAHEEPAAHGRESTYLNWSCRCQPCTTAHTQADRVRKTRLRNSRRTA